MIEFLLVISLLIILLAVAFDFGLFLQEVSVMTDAARIGGRVVLQHNTSCTPENCGQMRADLISSAQSTAENYLREYGSANGEYQVSLDFFQDSVGINFVTVHVRHANGRRFLFVPGIVGKADQNSTLSIRNSVCPPGSTSC